MFRSLTVALVLSCSAFPLAAENPAELQNRMYAAVRTFHDWRVLHKEAGEGPEYQQALAKRNAVLEDVAAKAKAAGLNDHLVLLDLYSYLERKDDVAREAKAALSEHPNDWKTLNAALVALTDTKLTDDALAVVRQWLGAEATELKAYLVPLESFPSGVISTAKLLAASGRAADGEQVLKDVEGRLDKLMTQFENQPAPPGQFPNATTVSNARIAVNTARLQMTFAASAPGTPGNAPPRPMPRPQAPGRMPTRGPQIPTPVAKAPTRPDPTMHRPIHRPTRPEMRTPTMPPLRSEASTIMQKFNEKYFDWSTRRGDAYRNDLAARDASLEQVLAKANAEQPVDHLTLAILYNDLGRADDAKREVQTAIKARPADLDSQATYLSLLCDLKLADDALAAFHRWLALDFAPEDFDLYLAPFGVPARAVDKMLDLLAYSGREADANQALDDLQKRIAEVSPKVANVTLPPERQTNEASLADANRWLNMARATIMLATQRAAADAQNPPGPADGSLNVTDEMYRILRKFSVKVPPGVDPKTLQEDPAQNAARNAALNELEKQALAEKKIDHSGLARLYKTLERPTDASREAQAAIAACAADFRSQIELQTLMNELGRTDDAFAAFRRWVVLDIPATDANAYLRAVSVYTKPIPTLVDLLTAAQRYTDALQAMDDWEKQLATLQGRMEQASIPLGGGPGSIRDLKNSVNGLRFEIEQKKDPIRIPVTPRS